MSQTVFIDGEKSRKAQIQSGVPQGTVLSPILSLLCINNIGEELTSRVCSFADDNFLFGIAKASLINSKSKSMLIGWKSGPTDGKWCSVLVGAIFSASVAKSLEMHDYMIKGKMLQHVQRKQYLSWKSNWVGSIMLKTLSETLIEHKGWKKRNPKNIAHRKWKYKRISHSCDLPSNIYSTFCITEWYRNSFFWRTIRDWATFSNNEILEL